MTKQQLRNLEATIGESVGDIVAKRQVLDVLWKAVEQTQAYITWKASVDEFSDVSDLVRLMLDCKEAADKADDLMSKIIKRAPAKPPTKEAIEAHHEAQIRQQQQDGA